MLFVDPSAITVGVSVLIELFVYTAVLNNWLCFFFFFLIQENYVKETEFA